MTENILLTFAWGVIQINEQAAITSTSSSVTAVINFSDVENLALYEGIDAVINNNAVILAQFQTLDSTKNMTSQIEITEVSACEYAIDTLGEQISISVSF
jgi:hypothetical protein